LTGCGRYCIKKRARPLTIFATNRTFCGAPPAYGPAREVAPMPSLLRSWKALAAGGLALALAAAAGAAWYRTTRPDYRLRHGQEALLRNDVDAAVREADRLEAAGHPDHARLLRGEIYYRSRRFADAVGEFTRIASEGDLRLEAAALDGQCRLHLNDLREAHRAFSYVLDHRPDHLVARRGMADVYYHLGAITPALRELEKVAKLDDRDGTAYRFMGHLYKDVEQNDKSAECFEAALARDLAPADARLVREELADLLVSASEFGRAKDVLDRCPPEEAARPALVALRADCLWGLGRHGEARALLDPTLAAHPGEVPLLAARARIHMQDGEPAEAAKLLERAVAAQPREYDHRYRLALAYEALGRSAGAAEQRRLAKPIKDTLEELNTLTKAAIAHPFDGKVRRRLAETCRWLGKPDLAKMWDMAAAGCPPAPPGEEPSGVSDASQKRAAGPDDSARRR
jgi:tetratricopeptide (TPR) repeat protein